MKHCVWWICGRRVFCVGFSVTVAMIIPPLKLESPSHVVERRRPSELQTMFSPLEFYGIAKLGGNSIHCRVAFWRV